MSGASIDWCEDLPERWTARRLKYLTTCNDEVLPEDTPPEVEIQYVDIGSVSGMGRIETTETMTFVTSPSRARRVVRSGDVLVSTVRTYLTAIASVANAPNNLIASTGFAVIRCGKEASPAYVKYVLRTDGFIGRVIASSVGVSYPAINASDLVRILIPIPAVSEQTKVGQFLDYETARIDALIEKQQQLIALLKEKRQAVISHAVNKGLNPNAPLRDSGVEWVGKVPAHWEVRRLKRISEKLQGRLIVQPQRFFADDGVPIVFGYNIKNGRIDEDGVSRIAFDVDRQYPHAKAKAGDVYTVRLGDPGATAVVPPTLDGCHFASIMWIHQHPRFSSDWLAHCMNSEVVRRQVESVNYGAAQTQFNISDAVNFVLPFPPLLEQQQIGRFVDEAMVANDARVSKAEEMSTLLQERRTALISAAVTGKIDVRAWTPPNSDAEQNVA